MIYQYNRNEHDTIIQLETETRPRRNVCKSQYVTETLKYTVHVVSITLVTRLLSNRRQTTRKCVYFRSRDKDGGDVIRPANASPKTPCCTETSWLWLYLLYIILWEKRPKRFFISSTNLGRFWWTLVHSFLNKLAAKSYKRFPPHLNNVSNYLVKLNVLIAQMLSLSGYKNKLQNLSHLNYGFQIRQIWIQLITAYGEYCEIRCKWYVFWTPITSKTGLAIQ